mmetsp:Transcript_149090/g.477491  ORF Transcript_149090/g.477491 Transcript_149090/m.477491 type:complete len:208 (+) Transcript_149090:980-1603(+)
MTGSPMSPATWPPTIFARSWAATSALMRRMDGTVGTGSGRGCLYKPRLEWPCFSCAFISSNTRCGGISSQGWTILGCVGGRDACASWVFSSSEVSTAGHKTIPSTSSPRPSPSDSEELSTYKGRMTSERSVRHASDPMGWRLPCAQSSSTGSATSLPPGRPRASESNPPPAGTTAVAMMDGSANAPATVAVGALAIPATRPLSKYFA